MRRAARSRGSKACRCGPNEQELAQSCKRADKGEAYSYLVAETTLTRRARRAGVGVLAEVEYLLSPLSPAPVPEAHSPAATPGVAASFLVAGRRRGREKELDDGKKFREGFNLH